MKKLMLLPLAGLLALIPGDSEGMAPRHGGGRPAGGHPASAGHAAPHMSAPMHTPSFSMPRSGGATHAARAPGLAAHQHVGAAGARGAGHSGGGMAHRSPMGGGGQGRMGGGGQGRMGGGGQGRMMNRPSYLGRGINIGRPNGIYRPGYAMNHDLYSGWHHGYWGGWYTRPWLWFGAGAGAGWLYSDLYADYWNPYWAADAALASVFDYSQPIPVPAPEAVEGLDDTDQSAPSADTAAAAQLLDDARQAFIAGDYDRAQSQIDKAVVLSPSDTTLHEFRALVLFARGRYAEATAAIYDVLAVAPGWDWETLRSLYPDTAIYEKQLRKLEAFARANPKDAAPRFLLAYHYLVIADRSAATKMLQDVVTLQPRDQLAAHLLGMIQGTADQNRPRPTP